MDDETKQLLDLLYRGGGYAHYWSLPSKKSVWFPVGEYPEPPNGKGTNAYMSVHTVDEPGGEFERVRNANVRAISALYADFDFKMFDLARKAVEPFRKLICRHVVL